MKLVDGHPDPFLDFSQRILGLFHLLGQILEFVDNPIDPFGLRFDLRQEGYHLFAIFLQSPLQPEPEGVGNLSLAQPFPDGSMFPIQLLDLADQGKDPLKV